MTAPPDAISDRNVIGGVTEQQRSGGARRAAIVLVVIACVPVVVACVRAILHHWTPISDDGLIALRAQDVFSRHFPLLGTGSSASASAPRPFNNPGPLYFDLLASPVRLFGSAAGTAIGVALVNVCAIAVAGLAGWRRAGVWGTTLAALIAATLAWSMGSELLFDPWQPHGLLLAFLAFLFVVWCVAVGDVAMLPVAVFVGSLLAQTHLTYGFLAPGLLAVALVVGIGHRRHRVRSRRVRSRRDRSGRDRSVPWDTSSAPTAGRAAPWIVAAVLVGVVVWTPSLVEQLTHADGNASRITHQLQHPAKHVVGASGAVRLTATVVARPPFWLRDSFSDTFRPPGAAYGALASSVDDSGAVGTRAAVVALGAVLALMALAWLAGRRNRDPSVTSAVVIATAGLALSWYTAAKVTTDTVGIAPHQFRFMWPVAAFATFTILFAVGSQLRSLPSRRWLQRGVMVGVIGMSAWNVPGVVAHVGPQIDEGVIPTVRALDRQLGAAAKTQPVLVDFSRVTFSEPFSGAIMAELRRRDIDFVTTDRYLGRQLGPRRESNGHDVRVKLFYQLGAAARHRAIGPFRRIAFVDGLESAQRRRLQTLESEIGTQIATHGLRQTARLRDGMKLGLFGALRGPFTTGESVQRVFRSGQLATAVDLHALDVGAAWEARLRSYAALQKRSDQLTIGVFTGPAAVAIPTSA